MRKRKIKSDAGRVQARRAFKICKNPMVHFADTGPLPDADDRIGLTRTQGKPLLFAIARDARTIFASWSIDWRSVFEKEIPADRRVHLRAIVGGGVVEATVAVEPMSEMHYLTISGLHNSYRVEIGYFQPFDSWNSVATSDALEMPSQGGVEPADMDLATIPFHLSFHQLANLLGTHNDTSIAKVLSAHQKRLLNGDEPSEAAPFDTQILRDLSLSLPEIAAAERDFKNIDTSKLARHAHAMFRVAATSPPRGFRANLGL